jgi:iron complex transport system ATP-binding protein
MDKGEVVSLKGVALDIDGKRVLSDVDWVVRRGESWAVLGPNGAGKTCLLSIVDGYRWPSEGDAVVLGRRFGATDLRDLRKEVGMISSYLDGMVRRDESVLDFVVSGRYGSTRLWKRAEESDKRRARSLLRLMGILAHQKKRLGELSQGERQRAAIARALMARPRLLVLDEPFEGLDMGSREGLIERLGKVAEEGDTTLILVAHRTEDIPKGFTHALLLRKGGVVASGEARATLTAENLSRTFGVDVRVRRLGGRYFTRASPG